MALINPLVEHLVLLEFRGAFRWYNLRRPGRLVPHHWSLNYFNIICPPRTISTAETVKQTSRLDLNSIQVVRLKQHPSRLDLNSIQVV